MKKLSQRRADERAEKLKQGREIVERMPCDDGVSVGTEPMSCKGKMEMARARNGELLLLLDDKIIGTRGPMCWITEQEGTAIFDTDDRNGIELQYEALGPDGNPLAVGSFCINETANAVFEKRQERPKLH